MYVTQIYCESVDCNVREVEVRTKDFDQVDPREWYCPACRKPAKIHWRRTAEEYEAHENRDAIGRVNMQLYARDQRARGEGLIAFPTSVMMFDQLPDDWSAKV